MLFNIRTAFRARLSQAGQGLTQHFLILAPLSAVLALTVCTLIIAGSN